jgi:RNA polymerase sporulation-specific sigma factor
LDFRDYNDFEIINLIKQGNEEALELMIEKYRYLIAKKIKKFNLIDDYDDCFQEGLLVLYKSAVRFDERFCKSFTRFFERNYENHLISIIRKRTSYGKFLATKSQILVNESLKETPSITYTHSEIATIARELSAFERAVFDWRILGDKSLQEIARELDCDVKKVYNAMDRIKHKLKIHLQ